MFTLVPQRSGDRLEDLGNISRQIKVQKADVDYVLMTFVSPLLAGWQLVAQGRDQELVWVPRQSCCGR